MRELSLRKIVGAQLFWLSLLLSLPLSARASGLAISPGRLSANVSAGQATTAVFTVSNPDAQTQAFEIYPDEFSGYIRISPQVFTLSPGGIKQITAEVSPEIRQEITGPNVNISVISHPLSEQGTQIATGAKLVLEIKTRPAQAAPSGQKLLIGLIALGSLVAAAAWQKLNR